MFTGLIEEVGRVVSLDRSDSGVQLELTAPRLARTIAVGESVAVNGCCLTATARSEDRLTFDLLTETLDRTNLKQLRRDSPVNLERALSANARLGGHFVQGHTDCTAKVISFEPRGSDRHLEIDLPTEFARYAAEKGSIAINGISLTIAELSEKSFVVWIIPHTNTSTNIGDLGPGDLVNLEFDILAKYVERLLRPQTPSI